MLRDYYNQVEGKRNKSLLNDYNYCKFVLECVEIQKVYLEKINSLVNVEVKQEDQESVADITDVMNVEKDKMWLSAKETATKFGLSYNRIKDRKWRIENDFPYKGFDEKKVLITKLSLTQMT